MQFKCLLNITVIDVILKGIIVKYVIFVCIVDLYSFSLFRAPIIHREVQYFSEWSIAVCQMLWIHLVNTSRHLSVHQDTTLLDASLQHRLELQDVHDITVKFIPLEYFNYFYYHVSFRLN